MERGGEEEEVEGRPFPAGSCWQGYPGFLVCVCVCVCLCLCLCVCVCVCCLSMFRGCSCVLLALMEF